MKRGRWERDREIGKYGKGEMEGERKLNEERREDRERKLVRIGRESVWRERKYIFKTFFYRILSPFNFAN